MPPKVEGASAPVMLTNEQFQSLLGQITATAASMTTTQVDAPLTTSGNFAKCTSRFNGDISADVEAFLDAVLTYKDCVNISDDNALKGLSMLLEGIAATWWKGVKGTIRTWTDAVTALRDAYSRKLPPHLVFRELFVREQRENEKTELFVCHIRSLISQLPYTLNERVQLDITYGLLKRSIKNRVSRDNFDTFKTLLVKARDVELSQGEMSQNHSDPRTSKEGEKKSRPRCTFCKNFGHVESECRKARGKNQETVSNGRTTTTAGRTQTPADLDSKQKTQLTCFGCGTPGFIRSNCPNCGIHKNPPKSVANNLFDFSASTTCTFSNTSRPMIPVRIAGLNGIACVDTGSKGSIAGAQLYAIFTSLKIPWTETTLETKLADGKPRTVFAKLFEVDIILENRKIPMTLIAIPEHTASKMLLGIDFIRKANMNMDLANDEWFFTDEPETRFTFLKEECAPVLVSHSVQTAEILLREDEAKHLESPEKETLNTLLTEYADLFAETNEPTTFAEHVIKLNDDTPIAVPPYRLPPTKKEFLEQELEKMLANGVIEECDSPYAAPVVLVPKKTGSYRVCVDYRKLNSVTVPDRYPLPRIDDLLHSAKRSKYMSTLDLRSGYWQVPVRQEDRDKTAFTTPMGNFRFKRMPFGLRNAPSTFQRLIDRFRRGLRDIVVFAYLDDLIIVSESCEEHLQDLRQVFDRLRMFNLHVNRPKCMFLCQRVKYLGHVLTPEGIESDADKIAAIVTRPEPKNVKELLSFIQTASWFRKFIPNYAEVCRPLTQLTRKNIVWKWGPAETEAFVKIKTLLTSAPILRQADHNQPFFLYTDASAYALGAALLQGEPHEQKPIEYASRLLSEAERNYSTTEREALAVVWATNKFRGYIETAQIQVISDHQPLRWLLSLRSPTGRLARWALSIQSYNLDISYTPGKCNAVADTLSRPPTSENAIDLCSASVNLPVIDAMNLRMQQIEDPDLKIIIDALESNNSVDAARWSNRGYIMQDGILYRYSAEDDVEEAQQVVSKSQISKILYEYHDSPLAGHHGIERTIQKIKSRFYWPGIRRSVTEHIKECIECQRFKPSNLKPSGLLQTPIQNRRFEVLAIDLIGPLPATERGHRWIFVVEDTATRWIEMFPLVDATAEACARCLIDDVILRYGTPRRVISDNGSQFVSQVMQMVAYCLGFHQNLVPAYHPEANPVERKNRDIKTQLSILTSSCHQQWDTYLPCIRFAMNTSTCATTGYTPAFFTFGRELRTPDDVERDLRQIIKDAPFVPQISPYLQKFEKLLSEIRESCELRQDHAKKYADLKRREGPNYEVGNKVLVDVHALSNANQSYTAKFAPRRDGPYLIIKQLSPTTYQIASPKSPDIPLGVYHSSALTPFVDSTRVPEPEPVRPLRRRGRPRKNPATSDTNPK